MFRERNLNQYIDLLWDIGRRSFKDLTDSEKEITSGLIMQDTPFRNRYDAIVNSDIEDRLPDLVLKFLISGENIDGKEILSHLRKETVDYYSQRIEKLFENKCCNLRYLEKYDADYQKIGV